MRRSGETAPVANRAVPEAGIAEEERLRAQTWRLLGRLLRAPPDAATLSALAGLSGDDSVLGRRYADLAKLARAVGPNEAAEEYAALFVGLTHGELIPYASYYLTGFLHEKPLARLRADDGRPHRGRVRYRPAGRAGGVLRQPHRLMGGALLRRSRGGAVRSALSSDRRDRPPVRRDRGARFRDGGVNATAPKKGSPRSWPAREKTRQPPRGAVFSAAPCSVPAPPERSPSSGERPAPRRRTPPQRKTRDTVKPST